jgi:hypothetical protein
MSQVKPPTIRAFSASTMRCLFALLFCACIYGLELPAHAHPTFSWWMSVDINGIDHRVRIWADGGVEISFYDGLHERTEVETGHMDKEWAAKAYALAREAIDPLKLDAASSGVVERILTLDFDLSVAGLILSIKESAMKPGLYQKCIDHVLAAETTTGIKYIPIKKDLKP